MIAFGIINFSSTNNNSSPTLVKYLVVTWLMQAGIDHLLT